MNTKQKNSTLVAGIVSGIVSLPLPWMTIPIPFLHMFGESSSSPLPMVPSGISVNAFNGSVNFLVTTPIWLVVCIAVAASSFQLMRQTKMFEVPNFAVLAMALVAVGWTTVPIIEVLASGQASLGIGWLFGLVSATVPLGCLAVRTTDPPTPTKSPQLN